LTKSGQGFFGVPMPMARQKMIIADIDDHACKSPAPGTDPAPAGTGHCMGIGISVYLAMECDSMSDIRLKTLYGPALDNVSQQLTAQRVMVLVSQKQVG
jgi:hypothetical protein